MQYNGWSPVSMPSSECRHAHIAGGQAEPPGLASRSQSPVPIGAPTGRPVGRHYCPACHADLISIDGTPPAPRFAVFACGSREAWVAGHYSFNQTPDCVALAEERGELDLPEAAGW